jgi:hypothetical protein
MPASYVVVRRATGQAVFETFNHEIVALVNLKAYNVVPIMEWLQSLNGKP